MKQINLVTRALLLALCLLLLLAGKAMASDGILRPGDRGDEVRAVQTTLKALDYKLTVDGVFGEETEAAVKLFQKRKGITADGKVGLVTLNKLYSGGRIGDGVLRPGEWSEEVRKMQNTLKNLGYPVTADGVFGKDTLAAVKAFQTRNRLRVDGAAGEQTLGLLYSGKALGYAGEAGKDTTAVVDTQRGRVLHLRSSASDTNAKNIMANIPSGTRLTVLSKGGSWTKVKYAGKTGYVQTGFLRFPSTPAKELPAIKAGEASVVTQPGRSLNLRSSKSKAGTGNIIANIPSGAVVRLHESGVTWSKVSYEGRTGYVLSGYLRLP